MKHQGHEEDKSGEGGRMVVKCKKLPELFQVVVECRDEGEQRELWERMREEGRRVRLLVLLRRRGSGLGVRGARRGWW